MSPCIFYEHLWWVSWLIWCCGSVWEWNNYILYHLSFSSSSLLASSKFYFQRSTWSNFELKKHGMFSWGCIWTWTHNFCKREFSAQCKICILDFLHAKSCYGLLISNLEVTKLKQHTSAPIESRTLSTKKNTIATQITSSHASSLKEMKEGNYYIHVGIIISNSPSFGFWNQHGSLTSL